MKVAGNKAPGGGDEGENAPMFSIIIPAYNVSPFIAEALESIRSQTYRNFETILINDGSSDTEALKTEIEPFLADLTYLEQENLGAAAARNAGIIAASGKYVAFLDGDDVWLPEYLETQLRFIEAGGHTMAYCDAYLFDESGTKTATFMDGLPSIGPVTTLSLLDLSCVVITSGTVCLREALIEADLFDSKVGRIEDFDMWFRLAKKGNDIGYHSKPMVKYRVRTTGLTGDSVASAERSVDGYKMIKKKYDLTEDELGALTQTLNQSEAHLELEKGKAHLREHRFDDARRCFVQANKFQRSWKLKTVTALMAVYPSAGRWLLDLASKTPTNRTDEA